MDRHKKIKVLFVAPTPPPYTGLEVMSRFFLESSLKNEFELIHIRSSLNSSNQKRGRLRASNLSRFIFLCCQLLLDIIRSRPQVVYTIFSENVTGFLRSSAVILIGSFLKKKIVIHLYGSNLSNFYNHSGRVFKGWIKYVLRHVDRVIVLGSLLKNQFNGIYPSEKIRIVCNGIPVERFALATDRYNKQCSNISRVQILFLGQLSQAKGFNDILKAIPLILEECPAARFIFAGERIKIERNILFDAYSRKIIFEEIDGLLSQLRKKYPSKIQFLSSVAEEEKEELFLQADIFVLPSYSEGFPMTILEAMTFGLPVITTPVGVLPEFLKDGIHCFFIPINDYRKLAERIIYLINNPDIRFQMGQNNYFYVRDKLNIDRSVEAMSSIFKETVFDRSQIETL